MQLKNTYLFNIYGVRSFLFTAVCVFKKKIQVNTLTNKEPFLNIAVNFLYLCVDFLCSVSRYTYTL